MRQEGLRHFAGKGNREVTKKRVGRHTEAFREMAVERMEHSDNISKLAAELGVNRGQLYSWRRRAKSLARKQKAPPGDPRLAALRRDNEQLKRALADKTLEADFFAAALQKIAARRQTNSAPGETASTITSGT